MRYDIYIYIHVVRRRSVNALKHILTILNIVQILKVLTVL